MTFSSTASIWPKLARYSGIITRDFQQILQMNVHRPKLEFVQRMLFRIALEAKQDFDRFNVDLVNNITQRDHTKANLQLMIDGIDYFESGIPLFALVCCFNFAEHDVSFICMNPITGEVLKTAGDDFMINGFTVVESETKGLVNTQSFPKYINLMYRCAGRISKPTIAIDDDYLLSVIAKTKLQALINFV